MTENHFDPNQPRDWHGRWSSDGGHPMASDGVGPFDTPPNAEWPRTLTDLQDEKNKEGARRVGLAAQRVADELHYDPRLITITDRDYDFVLNGKNCKAAGTHLNGQVTLYMGQLNPGSIREVVAHEIEHAKFYAFLQDKELERKEILGIPHDNIKTISTLPEGTKSVDVMKPDGSLRAPYDEKFPAYSAAVKYMDGDNEHPDLHAKMMKEDGCTVYSKEYWTALENGTTTVEKAYHETLAEMAAVRMRSSDERKFKEEKYGLMSPETQAAYRMETDFAPPTAKPPDAEGRRFLTAEYSRDWQALYNAVSANWEKRHR